MRLGQRSLCREINRCLAWFNEHRPHTTLDGKTPDEAYRRTAPANCQATSAMGTKEGMATGRPLGGGQGEDPQRSGRSP